LSEVILLGALELGADRLALGHEASGRLLAGEGKDAEAEPALQAAGTHKVAIRNHTGQRQRQCEERGPSHTGQLPDHPRLDRPEQRKRDDARQEARGRVVGFLPRQPAGQAAGDQVREAVDDGAVDEEGEAHDRLPRAANTLAAQRPSQPRLHRLVLHVTLSQEGAVALDPLPEPLHPFRVARLEVVHGVDAGPPEGIDLPGIEASGSRELADQRTPVELLDRGDQLGRPDMFEVHDLGFHRLLDRSRQSIDRLARVLPMGVEVGRQRERLSEGDEHPPQE